jgi:hypothetical protein
MRKIFSAIIGSLLLIACAGVDQKSMNMSEDLGSPQKEALLRERAEEFWAAFVNRDYERVYDLYDPFYRARTAKTSFLGSVGMLQYREFEIKDIKVEGNVAKVTVEVVFYMPKFKMQLKEYTVPDTKAEFQETWLYVYDNWYKEFYMESIEAGIAKY